jgi:hypothetical protein
MNKTLLATIIAAATLGIASNAAYAQDAGASTITISPTDTAIDDSDSMAGMDHSNMVMQEDGPGDISSDDLIVTPSEDDSPVAITGVDGDSPEAIEISPDDSGAVNITGGPANETIVGDDIGQSNSTLYN